MLEINEIFGPTIQGEGKLVGSPSILLDLENVISNVKVLELSMKLQVELKKCACDSYYAVDTEFKDTWTKYKSMKK